MNAQDPYSYPDTQVLKNKADIRDPGKLADFEYEMAGYRSAELKENPIKGNFDLKHLQAIHHHQFQDVYEWAGDLRTVGIGKGGSAFCQPGLIEGYANSTVFKGIARDNYLRNLNKDAFVDRLGHHFSEINALHPFRDGNGRSTREFLTQLSTHAGYKISFKNVDPDRWNDASRSSFNGNNGPIKEIFSEVIQPLENIDIATPAIAAIAASPSDRVKANFALDKATGAKFDELIHAEERMHPGDKKLHDFVQHLSCANPAQGSAAQLAALGRDIRLKTQFAAPGSDVPAGVSELMNEAPEWGEATVAQNRQPAQTIKEPDPKAPCIGTRMQATEYASALEKIGGPKVGKIDCPKSGGEYCGKVIQFSDTHIVQHVGKNVAIAHDVKQLSNGAELLLLATSGKLQGKHFEFRYDANRGIAAASHVQPVRGKSISTAVPTPRHVGMRIIKR